MVAAFRRASDDAGLKQPRGKLDMSKASGSSKKPSKTESPARHYQKPQEVVRDATLTPEEKRKALETWTVDAEALQRAEDEGMSGGESSKLIDVVSAKKELVKMTDDRPLKK
jgi:Fe-S cluster assembly ATPase SufC